MRSTIARFALIAAFTLSGVAVGAKESLGVFEQWAAFRDPAQVVDAGGAVQSHQIDQPPSMAKACPVVKADIGPAR